MSLSLTEILALLGIIITIILNGKRLSKIPYNVKHYLSNVIQRENYIGKYFDTKIPNEHEIDIIFYQFGLRKNLPLMDWLYLEYVKYIHKKSNNIRKFVIFPTIDGTVASQTENDFLQFSKNIDLLFQNSGIEVIIINPFCDNYFNNNDFVLKEFVDCLKYIGSSEYFEELWSELSIKINNISDFNKYHPAGENVKNIFTHIYKSWCIIKYLDNEVLQDNEKNISIIIWEWEVDKYGVMKYYLTNITKRANILFCPVLGRTVMHNRKTSIPVFVESETICVFDDRESIINKAIKFSPFLKKYNSILESVLLQYIIIDKKNIREIGKKIWDSYAITHREISHNYILNNNFYYFLGLITKIRFTYEN